MVLKHHAAFLVLLLLAAACDSNDVPPGQTKAPTERREYAENPRPLAPDAESARPAPVPLEVVREVAGLIDPARLDGLRGKRAANRTLRRVCFVLETARQDGHEPAAAISRAQERLGHVGTPRADAVREALLRNLDILEKLGCLDAAGMGKLETSNAPTIGRGPYAGDIASVDHIIPRSVAEELDERLYNLEFMPSRMNTSKGNRVTQRQVQLGRRWHKLGLLSEEGLRAVERAWPN